MGFENILLLTVVVSSSAVLGFNYYPNRATELDSTQPYEVLQLILKNLPNSEAFFNPSSLQTVREQMGRTNTLLFQNWQNLLQEQEKVNQEQNLLKEQPKEQRTEKAIEIEELDKIEEVANMDLVNGINLMNEKNENLDQVVDDVLKENDYENSIRKSSNNPLF